MRFQCFNNQINHAGLRVKYVVAYLIIIIPYHKLASYIIMFVHANCVKVWYHGSEMFFDYSLGQCILIGVR